LTSRVGDLREVGEQRGGHRVPGEDVRAPAQDEGRRGGRVVQQTPQLWLDLLRGAPAGPGGVPAG
jgi:hypothetical protein